MSPHEASLNIRFQGRNMRSSRLFGQGRSMSRMQRGLDAYGEVQNQQIKQISDPEQLIKLLFDKACVLVRASKESLEQKNDESFQKSCLHALQIVLSLRFVLKIEEGDTLSKSLFDTYTAIAASLYRAKENQDELALSKIYEALEELREAWGMLLSKED